MWALFVILNKSMNFTKRLNRGNFYFSNQSFQISKFPNNWRYDSYGQIQNFSSISEKLCLLGEKNTGTCGLNATIT